jgi:putative DNA primase/helicase
MEPGGAISLADAKRRRRAGGGAGGGADRPGAELVEGFEMRADGLWRTPRGEVPFRVSGRFEIVAESRPAASDEWGLLLEWCDRDGTLHRYIMPRRLLAGDAVEVLARMAACGLDLNRFPGARLALLQFLSAVQVAPRVRTVPRTGWHRPPGGGAAFVLPGRSFGDPGGELVMLDLDPAPTIYRSAGTLAGWREEVAARCAGNSRLAFAVSCAFAAPLLELAGDEGGGVNLRGASSSGKTTCVDAAASVWGAPSKLPDSFVRSWRSTANALEATAAAHSGALLPMDELGQADPAEVGPTLYMLANGLGKARARASGGNRQAASWVTLLLSSSEESAASLAAQAGKGLRAGQEVRLLDVPATVPGGFGCFDSLHGEADGSAFAQAIRRGVLAHHGHAAPAFLAWLAERLLEAADFSAAELGGRVRAWLARHVPAGADGQVHRAGRRLALVAVAGELATEAGLTGWPAGEASTAAAVILRDWLAERGGTGSREDQHLVTALRRFLAAHGAARFEVVRDPADEAEGAQVEPALPEGARIAQRAGWRWQEVNEAGARRWIYGLQPDVFAVEVAGPLGLEERDARARLGRSGLIRAERAGKETRWAIRAKSIPGIGRPRLIVVEPIALEGD